MKPLYYIVFLWICVFAGYSQKVNLQKFSVKDGLSQSTVKFIEQDNYGNLWLATNNGLSRFNGKTFDNFTTTNGLPSNEISNLLFANDILFIGTKKGFCSFDGHNVSNNDLYHKIKGNVKKFCIKKTLYISLPAEGIIYWTLPLKTIDSTQWQFLTLHPKTLRMLSLTRTAIFGSLLPKRFVLY